MAKEDSGGGQPSGTNPDAKVPAEGMRPMGRSGGSAQGPRVMPENTRPLPEGEIPPERTRRLPLDDSNNRW